jgi:hypothetical protein
MVIIEVFMHKGELNFLEKVFICELEGHLFQSKSKYAKKMEENGFIVKTQKNLGKDRFGEIIVSGYALTLKGNFAYCTSERCSGKSDI